MKTNAFGLVTVTSLAVLLSACSQTASEPKTPEERIAADEEKLEEREEHGVTTGGTETETIALEQDIEKAKKEEAQEQAAPKE